MSKNLTQYAVRRKTGALVEWLQDPAITVRWTNDIKKRHVWSHGNVGMAAWCSKVYGGELWPIGGLEGDLRDLQEEVNLFLEARRLQQEFEEKHTQSYLKIEFANSSWQWGYITFRYNASGGQDGEAFFKTREELVNLLRELNERTFK